MSWVVAGGQEPPPLPTTPAALPIERFLQRNDPPLRSYRARRRLEARNARFKAEGWMEVTTELGPNQRLSWAVTAEGGSGYIRNRVLRKALEAEVAAIRAGDPAKAAITERNYTFLMSDSAGDGTVTVRIEPRRHDVPRRTTRTPLLDREADRADLHPVEAIGGRDEVGDGLLGCEQYPGAVGLGEHHVGERAER